MRSWKWAALGITLLMPACDDGEDFAPSVTGSIAASVTIDGAPAPGVTVTLSNGRTATTGAGGVATFSDVGGSAYTVTISGYPADVTFSSTVQTVVISTNGQQANVTFAGTRIATSSITGSVTSAGAGIAGVTVTIAGPSMQTVTTNAQGAYSASGLLAGTYTVTISGYDAQRHACDPTSREVAVAAGGAGVADFNCTSLATSALVGRLFGDWQPRNGLRDAGEPLVPRAGVRVYLDTLAAVTDTLGVFRFLNLLPGTYTLGGDSMTAVPYEFTRASRTVALLPQKTDTLDVGIDLKLLSLRMTARVGDFGLPGATFEVRTDPAAQPLATDTTDATGTVTIPIPRSALRDAGGFLADTLFVRGTAQHYFPTQEWQAIPVEPASGEPGDRWYTFLTSRLLSSLRVEDPDGEGREGWLVDLRRGDGTTAATATTDAAGIANFTYDFTAQERSLLGQPIGWSYALNPVQPRARSNAWMADAVPANGAGVNGVIREQFDGAWLHSETRDLGYFEVLFRDVNVGLYLYNEVDQLPGRTGGDDLSDIATILADIFTENGDELVGTAAPDPEDGKVEFRNVPAGFGYYVVPRSTTGAHVFSPTRFDIDLLDGARRWQTFCATGSRETDDCATFSYMLVNPLRILDGGDFTFNHIVGGTACPQLIGAVRFLNNGTVSGTYSVQTPSNLVSFQRSGGMMMQSSISGSIAPGAEITTNVYFNCGAPTSFTAPYTATLSAGGNTTTQTWNIIGTINF